MLLCSMTPNIRNELEISLFISLVLGAQHAERSNAERLVLVAPDEWAERRVRIKTLATREEVDIAVDELVVGGLPSF